MKSSSLLIGILFVVLISAIVVDCSRQMEASTITSGVITRKSYSAARFETTYTYVNNTPIPSTTYHPEEYRIYVYGQNAEGKLCTLRVEVTPDRYNQFRENQEVSINELK